MINRISISLLLCFILQGTIYSQKPNEVTGDKKYAEEILMAGDYVTALKEYQYLYTLDSANSDLYFPLAFCYLNSTINKAKAIPLFEKVVAQKNFDYEAYYQLAMAYQIAGRFDDAIGYYEKYKTKVKGSDKNKIPAERCIEMCNNAKELIQHPVNVTFENMGAHINSPYPDYNPYINKNENVIFYSSKKPGNLGGMMDYDGYYTADIFTSENKYGEWGKSKRLASTINSPMIEETAGLSADASYLFVHMDNLEVKSQTQVSIKKGKSFLELRPMGININALSGGANSITITPDKKIVFFSSSKDGASVGSDIFMSKFLPSGQWGPAENLGKIINTKYDESYPSLSPDGKTLYFASAGHNSMGGLDIFRSEWNRADNTFSEPVNIGYPINTPDDNTSICFTASGRYAYISALRNEDSFGNLDIYRIIFNDVKAGYTTVKAILINKDSVNVYNVFRKELNKTIDSLTLITSASNSTSQNTSDSILKSSQAKLISAKEKLIKGPEIMIQVFNATNSTLTGTYKPNPETGKFIVILPPGKYNIVINCEGFPEYKESIKIEDHEMPVKEIIRSFQLTSKL
jgi:tetratricopeptide (TPR) repeat protein